MIAVWRREARPEPGHEARHEAAPEAARQGRREARLDIRWVVAGAWILALAAELTGRGSFFHHDQLIEGGLPRPAAFLLFLVAWQAMIAAMMLPSALPLIRLFNRASAAQPRARAARVAFVASYALVWTGFGGAAFLFDTLVHATVDASPWLLAHGYLIGGGTLIAAGVFQFSPLKEACLRQCRNPGAFLLRHYRRGVGRAFATGLWHGVFCLGCCWALMLVAFGAGVANLIWMAALTLLMTLEKRATYGPLLARVAGAWMALVGLVIVAQPLWAVG